MVQPGHLLSGMAVVAAPAPYGRRAAAPSVLSAALVDETNDLGASAPYGFALAGRGGVLGTLPFRRSPVVPPDVALPRRRSAESTQGGTA
ncbi:membrane protein [Streptomyces badius]